MNTRLQVEHPVTELVTGIDLVEQMIRVASGEKLSFGQTDIRLNGWAIESRLYAEDPYRNFLPSIGRLTRYRPPQEGEQENGTVIRNDTGVFEGGEISMYYDPMIAKLCSWAKDRETAIDAMGQALDRFEVEGIGHNLPFLSAVMQHERFRAGRLTTGFIAEEFPEGFSGWSPMRLPRASSQPSPPLSTSGFKTVRSKFPVPLAIIVALSVRTGWFRLVNPVEASAWKPVLKAWQSVLRMVLR